MDTPLNYDYDSGNIHADHNNSQTSESKKQSRFGQSNKKQIQLTWDKIVIKALPLKKGMCGGRDKNSLDQPKLIIDDVSGTIMPGQFLAILGASGAGKTTLLNFLSGREISSNLEKTGLISVNGMDKSKISNFSAISAYVQQMDILFQTMSVKECLTLAAKLKLSGPLEDKLKRVDDLIAELRLQKCANTKIGGNLVKGVSGGERKRTSIGVELITDPMLIFLDEPTTGLDSFTAMSVVDTMKELAMSGRTVVSTIHQPSSEIYESFDRLMLLCLGKTIYFNESRFALDYFTNINFPCPEMTNPADYFMAIMSKETMEIEEEEGKDQELFDKKKSLQEKYIEKVINFDRCYQQSPLKNDHTEIFPNLTAIQDSHSLHQGASWPYQFVLLLERNLLNIWRIPQASTAKIFMYAFAAIIVIIVFVGGTQTYTFYTDDPEYNSGAVDNVNGALFYNIIAMGFGAVNNVILLFPEERPIFLREVNNNMYSPSAYFFGKIFSELPLSILLPTIFGAIQYYALNLSTIVWTTFPAFLVCIILIYLAGGSYALVIGTLVSDREVAMALVPITITPLMLFAGFFIDQASIPWYLYEIEYISFFKYGYQALELNQWGYGNIPACQMLLPTTSQYYCDPLDQFEDPEDPVYDLGVQLLSLLAIYIGCYAISLVILIMLASKFE